MPLKHSNIGSSLSQSCNNLANMGNRHKTPTKTPLKLCASTKKTPHTTKTNDRYIPNRVTSNMEVGYHLLINGKNQQENIENIHLYDHVKRRLINDTCNGASTGISSSQGDKAASNTGKEQRVLSLHSRLGSENLEQAFADNLKAVYNASTSMMNTSLKKSAHTRHVITQPEKILDAPEFRDDFCKYFWFCVFIEI
jgi:hypothetical protein